MVELTHLHAGTSSMWEPGKPNWGDIC